MTPAIDETHDPALRSWVESANGHADFPVQNLPFGRFSLAGEGRARTGVAIGEMVLELSVPGDLAQVLGDADRRRALRRELSAQLCDPAQRDALSPRLHARADVTMHLPFAVGNYTDFYAGIHHARNIGAMFRPDNPLLPNYKYVPIGYHGRASSVRVSGAPVHRPSGQRKAPDAEAPVFGPCRKLDYELELGVWIARGNALGDPVPIATADDHIAGLCLLNDWSARDLQAWEYQPLGPFLAKSFLTTVSPWVVTPEALAPFRIAQPPRPEGDPAPLDYLTDADDQARGAYNIDLAVLLQSRAMAERGDAPVTVATSSTRHMYWTIAQMVTHHASNGCDLQAGDLLGTGTISGPSADACGSLMETTANGTAPLTLPTGEARSFLEAGDTVWLTGRAVAEGFVPIGFGPCAGTVS